ncbi:MAG TPA: PQQ-binding-like beta-propeller repeat protein [Vicinamibacteria bacterium]|nr:PQQ-binding-like beta-propeller repeat protein [Vicinamibacteria bacterium]
MHYQPRWIVAGLVACMAPLAEATDWPQWRGPRGTGESAVRDLPVRWSRQENVAWSLPLPSGSGSTPVVSGERIFLGTVAAGQVELWCVERRTGAVRWRRPLGSAAGHTHQKHNMSSPSPVADGGRVYAMTGNGVLKAFDVEGRELWSRDIQADYGRFGLNWGYGSSPLLWGDTLYVQVLHGMKTDDPSYLLGLDAANGRSRFRVERPTAAVHESPDSYSTPAVARRGGEAEIVVTGGDVVTGHDPKTGRELWRAGGLNPGNDGAYRIVASPVAVGDVVIAPTRIRPMLALKAFGRGDVTASQGLWSFDHGPDVPTPATDGRYLYVVTDRGMLYCLDFATGRALYGPQRLRAATYSASPLLADGKLYAISEEGVTSVVKAGPAYELLAENALDGYTLSSPLAAHGQLYIRTQHALYCIGKGVAAATFR